MRVAFSGNGFIGHLVPMFPLMRAFVAAGHEVAVLTSSDLAGFLHREASDRLVVLPAGPLAAVTMARMATETGSSPATDPVPPIIAEFFAGRQVDAGFSSALAAATGWAPSVVIGESMDFIGPLVAGSLGIPFYRHTFGPTRPRRLTEELQAVAVRRAEKLGVPLAGTQAVIDIFPAFLQAPTDDPQPRRLPLRPEIHHRDDRGDRTDRRDRGDRGDRRDRGDREGRRDLSPAVVAGEPEASREHARQTVLVTFGTVFTDPAVRESVVGSFDPARWDVIVTTGADGNAELPRQESTRSYVPFVPLDELLPGVDLVVTAGGAGTVLSALAAGLPMVIMPLGADHGINAARAEAAGVAVVVHAPADVGAAGDLIVSDPAFRDRARQVADRIRTLPTARAVADQLVDEIGQGTTDDH